MSQVLISWTPPTNLPSPVPANSGYNVYRGISAGAEGTTPINSALVPIGTNDYVDTNVQEGDVYYYTVKTVINGVLSAASVEAVSNPVPPQPPTNVTAVAS